MEIQDITIWSKGETKTATQIKVALTGDDLSSKAVFYYELLTADNIQLIGGTVEMKSSDYTNWNGSNQAAYEFVAQKLNINLK